MKPFNWIEWLEERRERAENTARDLEDKHPVLRRGNLFRELMADMAANIAEIRQQQAQGSNP